MHPVDFRSLPNPKTQVFHFTKPRRHTRRHFEPLNAERFDGKRVKAKDVLIEILNDGVIYGKALRGPSPAVCLFETPLPSSWYIQNRFSYYCIAIEKKTAFKMGGRKAVYLPEEEITRFFPRHEQWRVVKHNLAKKWTVDWTHEREWRIPDKIRLRDLDWFDIYIEKDEGLEDFTVFQAIYPNLRNILLFTELEPFLEYRITPQHLSPS